MGQFSDFVRPASKLLTGSYYNPATNLYVSAYKDPNGHLVIVAVNNDSSTTYTLNVTVSNKSGGVGQGDEWTTSSSQSLAHSVTLCSGGCSSGSFSFDISPQKIKTFAEGQS